MSHMWELEACILRVFLKLGCVGYLCTCVHDCIVAILVGHETVM